MQTTETPHESKTRILNAALDVFRAKGYAATRIEDICAAAGLTKGSFFHHFKTKEDLAIEAASHWGAYAGELFATAPYQTLADPRDRLLAYVDFRKSLMQGELPKFTCFGGTLVQEVYLSHPQIRDACGATFDSHGAALADDVAKAIDKYGSDGTWTAESLALHIQAVLQGAFILAKSRQSAEAGIQCVDHLRRYLEVLFPPARKA
ncbi:TetR/AcrR family transcriptional regulator [Nordella sp. HKS 07]|uniref:TetR/AcrR family transcriptional regulator n=1 Tax=Nordella sp. HKS 07 TaxID=2712222 RepID=UPI0013E10B15|nr:TetR/AcrR family transcriptional regulator [Nordella sp. HKS 07]QIG51544.1 TetR/AcrR family transcriptional regulator [Nordella sp. HKS 07]